MAENNMNESYATRIRNFVLEQKSRDGIEPVRGQMLYDADDNSIYYGKYDSGTESVNWSGFGGGMVEIEYDDLKDLRDNGGLTAGTRYRITDYETTTVQEHTSSAGHQFDIIVTAIDESTLSEDAQACHHDFGVVADENETVLRTYYYNECYRYSHDITFDGEICGVWDLCYYIDGEWVKDSELDQPWAASEFVFNVSLVNNKIQFSNSHTGVTDMKDVEMLAFIRNDEPRTSWANEDYLHENHEVIYLDKINTKYFSTKRINAHYVLGTINPSNVDIEYVVKTDGNPSVGYATVVPYSLEIGSNGLPRLYTNKEEYESEGKDYAYFEYRGDVFYARSWYSEGSWHSESGFYSKWVRCFGKSGAVSPNNGEANVVLDGYYILTNRIVGMELDDSDDTTIDIECRPSNLGAWTLKYSLDNDTDRFAWADTENGKGVIYFMRDEFGNEAPYDFKNIMYEGYRVGNNSYIDDFASLNNGYLYEAASYGLCSTISSEEGVEFETNYHEDSYTFSLGVVLSYGHMSNKFDATLNNNEYVRVMNNVIKESYDSNGKMVLPDVAFYKCRMQVADAVLCYGNAPSNCSFNTIESNCHDIRVPLDCHHCEVLLGSHDIIGVVGADYTMSDSPANNVTYVNSPIDSGYKAYLGSFAYTGHIIRTN